MYVWTLRNEDRYLAWDFKHAGCAVFVHDAFQFYFYIRLSLRNLTDSDKHVGISSDNILHSSCRRRAHIR